MSALVTVTWVFPEMVLSFTMSLSPTSPPPLTVMWKFTKPKSPLPMTTLSAPPRESIWRRVNVPRVNDCAGLTPSLTRIALGLFGSSVTRIVSAPAVPVIVSVTSWLIVVEISPICQMPRPAVPAISRWLFTNCRSCTTVFGKNWPYSDHEVVGQSGSAPRR